MGTPTANKGYTVPQINADFGTWGGELNGNLDILDLNLGGVGTISVAGNVNVIAGTAQAQNLTQLLTGTLTGNIEYLLPEVGGFYIIENESSGAYTINVGVGTVSAIGSTVAVGQGSNVLVYSDGVNVNAPGSAASNAPSWSVVTGSRVLNTTYTNSTGGTMDVSVWGNNSSVSASLIGIVNGVQIAYSSAPATPNTFGIYFRVPAGATYEVSITGSVWTLNGWAELSI